MAKVISLELDKKSWKSFERAIDSKYLGPVLRKNVGKATAKNALLLQRGVRQEIRKGVPPTNAPLTASLKGGNKPIVGTPGADLFNSITHDIESWDRAVVGVIRMSGAYNIAKIVHDGATIKVTERMRNLFRVLANASKSKYVRPHLEGRALELWELGKRWKTKWKPLKPSTTAIVIPPRPYLRYAVQDLATRRKAKENWQDAIERTWRKVAKK
jgi:hypothetical protein